jgi:hypothetical protein
MPAMGIIAILQESTFDSEEAAEAADEAEAEADGAEAEAEEEAEAEAEAEADGLV